jgi:diguanylate cyclase (GGDEF)-like protein/PAS domain S-box-containing protein
MHGLSAFVKSGDSVDKYTRVVETGEPLDEEFELDTPKAGRRWFRQQAVRVHDGLAITMRDITERKHNEQAVHAQRSFLQTLIDNIPVAVQVRSMKAAERGRIVLWNESYSVLFGIPVGQAIGKTVADVLSAASAERIEELDRQLLASPMVQEANDLTIVANGARRIVHVIRAPIFDAHNEVEYIISIVRDVTDEQARANEIRLASKVFETTADAIVITDAEDFTVMVNSAFSKLTGFTPEDMLGRLLSETPFRPTDPVESAARMEHLHREGYVTGEVQRVHKDGSELVLWVTATCSRDAGGKIINYVRVFTDISPLKEAQRKLEQMASYDTLTNLPNRRLFHDRLEHALSRASRSDQRVGLIFFDLDGFKDVNDTLGHDVGDQLLCEVAGRLRECVRESDSLCRLGGDEFTVIIENAMLPADAIRAAERIVQALATPFQLSGHEVKTTASIGIAMHPDDGAESTTLIKNADVAMYRAKQSGRDRFQVFSTVELV